MFTLLLKKYGVKIIYGKFKSLDDKKMRSSRPIPHSNLFYLSAGERQSGGLTGLPTAGRESIKK